MTYWSFFIQSFRSSNLRSSTVHLCFHNPYKLSCLRRPDIDFAVIITCSKELPTTIKCNRFHFITTGLIDAENLLARWNMPYCYLSARSAAYNPVPCRIASRLIETAKRMVSSFDEFFLLPTSSIDYF